MLSTSPLREIVIFSIDGLILVTMTIVLPILSIFALLFDRGSDAWMNVPYAFTVLGCWWLIAVGFRRRAAPIGQAVILLGLVGWMIGYLFILGIGT